MILQLMERVAGVMHVWKTLSIEAHHRVTGKFKPPTCVTADPANLISGQLITVDVSPNSLHSTPPHPGTRRGFTFNYHNLLPPTYQKPFIHPITFNERQ